MDVEEYTAKALDAVTRLANQRTETCESCGVRFTTTRFWQRFCCKACKDAFNTRRARRAIEHYDRCPIAEQERKDRNESA